MGIRPDITISMFCNEVNLVLRIKDGSRKVLGAQAFGIPEVVFDCSCGPSEVIRDGESGFLVPEGNVDAFAEALLRVINNEEERARMGKNALHDARRWDIETIMPQWIQLFEETLSSPR
jgi:glycosyltransferase involved in cell wall biosynthesis